MTRRIPYPYPSPRKYSLVLSRRVTPRRVLGEGLNRGLSEYFGKRGRDFQVAFATED